MRDRTISKYCLFTGTGTLERAQIAYDLRGVTYRNKMFITTKRRIRGQMNARMN